MRSAIAVLVIAGCARSSTIEPAARAARYDADKLIVFRAAHAVAAARAHIQRSDESAAIVQTAWEPTKIWPPGAKRPEQYHVRFEISVAGIRRPWRVDVVGHLTSPEGAAVAAPPGWLDHETDKLRTAIYRRLETVVFRGPE